MPDLRILRDAGTDNVEEYQLCFEIMMILHIFRALLRTLLFDCG